MNNLEWLYANDGYLNSFAKLMAQVDGHATDGFTAHEWLMAEHVEGRSTEVGKTSASSRQSDGMDSREQLEADVQKWCGKYAYQADMVWAWLNRQAAITERELCRWRRDEETKHDERIHRISELQRQYDELTAERDQLKEQHGRQVETIGRLQERNGELQERVDELEDERDELQKDIWAIESAGEAKDMQCAALDAERDKWKSKCEHYSTHVDRLMESICDLARKQPYAFDPEAPYENAELVAKYIDELEEKAEQQSNLEWLYWYDDELAGYIDAYVADEGYGYVESLVNAREWLQSPHVDDCGQNVDMSEKSADCVRNGGEMSDSREKLEAAVQTAAGYIYGRGFTNGLADAWNDDEVDTAANQIIQLLDRQAAITRAELVDCANCPITERNAKVIAELREQLDETKHAIAKAGGTWTEHEDGTVAVVFSPDVGKLLADLEVAHAKNRALKAHITQMQQGRHGWHVKAKELQERNNVQIVTIGRLLERNSELQEQVDDFEEEIRKYEHDCELLWQEKRELTAQRDKMSEELRIEREAVEACEGCSKVNKLQAKLDALKCAISYAGGMWMEEGGIVTVAFAPDVDELRAERDEYREKFGRALDLAHEIGRIAE